MVVKGCESLFREGLLVVSEHVHCVVKHAQAK